MLAVLLLLLSAGAVAPVAAQAHLPAANERLWLTGGLGRGTHGVAGVLALSFASGPHLLSLRGAGDTGITTTPSQADIGVLYGRMKRWSQAYVQASIGLAYVDNEFGGEGRPDGLGVPLAVGGAWTALPVLGVGLQGFADVNDTETFGGWC